MVALEYLLHPHARPPGMFKRMAIENNLTPNELWGAVHRIKVRVKKQA
jgi:hypothetical protein